MGDAVDGIEVRITDPDAADAVVARIQAELGPAYRVQNWQELNRNLFSALKLEKIAMFMVLAIIILVASFSIVSNLIMTVVEKGREIALLKTLGSGDGGIIGVFVIQGFLIGVIGTSLGVAAGLIGAWRLAVDGFPINPDVYYIDRLPVEIDPPTVLLVYGAGLLISIAATIYPSLVAAQLRPAEGLKQ
jgi:lipoprotein-releasing system permease protein